MREEDRGGAATMGASSSGSPLFDLRLVQLVGGTAVSQLAPGVQAAFAMHAVSGPFAHLCQRRSMLEWCAKKIGSLAASIITFISAPVFSCTMSCASISIALPPLPSTLLVPMNASAGWFELNLHHGIGEP
jgi:hypothetical protein